MECENELNNLIGLEYENLRNDRNYYFIDNKGYGYHLQYVRFPLSVMVDYWGQRLADLKITNNKELQKKVNAFFNEHNIKIVKYGLRMNE